MVVDCNRHDLILDLICKAFHNLDSSDWLVIMVDTRQSFVLGFLIDLIYTSEFRHKFSLVELNPLVCHA